MRTVLRKQDKGQEDRRKDKFMNKSCHRRVRDKRGNGEPLPHSCFDPIRRENFFLQLPSYLREGWSLCELEEKLQEAGKQSKS